VSYPVCDNLSVVLSVIVLVLVLLDVDTIVPAPESVWKVVPVDVDVKNTVLTSVVLVVSLTYSNVSVVVANEVSRVVSLLPVK